MSNQLALNLVLTPDQIATYTSGNVKAINLIGDGVVLTTLFPEPCFAAVPESAPAKKRVSKTAKKNGWSEARRKAASRKQKAVWAKRRAESVE